MSRNFKGWIESHSMNNNFKISPDFAKYSDAGFADKPGGGRRFTPNLTLPAASIFQQGRFGSFRHKRISLLRPVGDSRQKKLAQKQVGPAEDEMRRKKQSE